MKLKKQSSMDASFQQSMNKSLTPSVPSTLSQKKHLKNVDPEYHSDEEPFLEQYGLHNDKIYRNAPVPVLYEQALLNEKGSSISSTGALVTRSGVKTGRSPGDKRIVDEETTNKNIWWGPVNMKLSEQSFLVNRERALDYLNTKEQLYVVDGYAGWDDDYSIKVRVVCARAYHALFMRNMLRRPTPEELKNFGEPDFIIYNAGQFPCNRYTDGMSSSTSVSLNFKRQEMVILGTEYAGEMKKGVFTIMNYLMPLKGVLPLHSSCNEAKQSEGGKVSLFFGLSGTGKTTLSADPNRMLIGDDEHVWTDNGVFNIEGGCYAKCINLSEEKEPEIFKAIRFGSVLENIKYMKEHSDYDLDLAREVDYESSKITENTRCAYPLEFIPNAKLPAVATHPSNIILLTCDAFGVLPPVSKLTNAQAMYHFISGYTAKVAGTEVGVTEPTATFSACFGEPFIVHHPVVYAKLLAKKLSEHNADAWLVNTGWVGGGASSSEGHRISIKHTRAIIDAIHSGELAKQETVDMEIFGLKVPKQCPNVPDNVLQPQQAWSNVDAYKCEMKKLANAFIKNFESYKNEADSEIVGAGPIFPAIVEQQQQQPTV